MHGQVEKVLEIEPDLAGMILISYNLGTYRAGDMLEEMHSLDMILQIELVPGRIITFVTA